MTSVDYHQLAYHLMKRSQSLAEESLVVDIEENGNSQTDTLVLKHNSNFKVFHFTTQPYLWNRYRQFCFHTTGSGQFHFRLHPETNEPYWIQVQQSGYFTDCDYAPLPDDLREFAQEIYDFILRIERDLQQDKYTFDSQETRLRPHY